MNEEAINKLGNKPLQPKLAEISDVSDTDPWQVFLTCA
jgi:hypothetical protein